MGSSVEQESIEDYLERLGLFWSSKNSSSVML